MEEAWYSMEWVLAERKQALAAHAVRAARARSEKSKATRPQPCMGENRWRWQRGEALTVLTVTAAGGLTGTLAA